MEYPFNFFAFFLLLSFVIALVNQWKRSKTVHKLPPGPWKLPIVGNMHQLIGSRPHYALRKLAQKHGPLIHLQLGEISTIVVSSPRLAKEIMKTHDLAFANRAEFLACKIVYYNCSDIVCAPYGEYWRMRKICTLELLSTKNVRSFGSIRLDEAKHLISSIQAQAAAGELINLTEHLSTYTSSMVLTAAFGKVSKVHQMTFLRLLKESLPISSAFEVSDLFPSYRILHPLSKVKPKLMKVYQRIDKIFDIIIAEHVENLKRTKRGMGESGNEDLVDVLLRVKESGDLTFPVTNNNIKAVLMDIFTGGTETSSTTVEWAMSEMIRNPNVMAKAQNEIRKAFMGMKTIEETDVENLPYLKLVIKETLRLHPPIPLLVPRECREECEIDGYVIPIKTRVMINAWAIGRDPKYWDDAESFKPERYENSPVDFTGNNFEYLPFGAGRRICPVISFGLANVELPLALLLYHFDWKLPIGLNYDDLDMTETIAVTASRENNLLLLATMCDPDLELQPPKEY
ncbi:premnaspirodiene oxygenase-like [Coffea eugenioides]|uniref:premnaspirodiene oxygenase-like n=1 Tax=Coffea eugenioides TaxID=49369 RepID=UPI000F60D040|nr:premnaspirodiene oxygenase-like [Coffea eugenioides]